jgi:hypothetical protein
MSPALSVSLVKLLEQSFSYLSVPELRPVPVKVMKAMDSIPRTYLEQLITNPLYREFPIEVNHRLAVP